MYMWYGGGFLMWLIPLALIGVLVWILVDRSGSGTPRSGYTHSGDSAEDIVRRRYAKGEIDEEEYERLMSRLRSE